MNFTSLGPLLDTVGSMLTVAGILVTALGAIWVFFRKKIAAWWKPYQKGIDAMSEVTGIRRAVENTRRDIEHLRAGMTVLTLTMRARGDTNVDAAEYESSSDGRITVVNSTFARWLGVGKAEVMNFGWVNFIHPEDVARYRAEWDRCTEEHRTFRVRHRLVSTSGDIFEVDSIATPIPDAPPASHWIGVIRRVQA